MEKFKNNTVLFVGNLEHHKGVDDFCALACRLPNLQFILAGTGSLFKEYNNSNLSFVGHLDPKEVRLLYKKSKCVDGTE